MASKDPGERKRGKVGWSRTQTTIRRQKARTEAGSTRIMLNGATEADTGGRQESQLW